MKIVDIIKFGGFGVKAYENAPILILDVGVTIFTYVNGHIKWLPGVQIGGFNNIDTIMFCNPFGDL